MKQKYIKKEVSKETGIPARTVHYYTDRGLVVPDIENPQGRGTTRVYSADNILEFWIISYLQKRGHSLEVIESVMPLLRDAKKSLAKWWKDAVSGKGTAPVYAVMSCEPGKSPQVRLVDDVQSAICGVASVVVFDLAKIVSEVVSSLVVKTYPAKIGV